MAGRRPHSRSRRATHAANGVFPAPPTEMLPMLITGTSTRSLRSQPRSYAPFRAPMTAAYPASAGASSSRSAAPAAPPPPAHTSRASSSGRFMARSRGAPPPARRARDLPQFWGRWEFGARWMDRAGSGPPPIPDPSPASCAGEGGSHPSSAKLSFRGSALGKSASPQSPAARPRNLLARAESWPPRTEDARSHPSPGVGGGVDGRREERAKGPSGERDRPPSPPLLHAPRQLAHARPHVLQSCGDLSLTGRRE